MSQLTNIVEVTLSERIDLERRRKGWSWDEFAEQMGVGKRAVEGWRDSGWDIRVAQMLTLCKVLGIDPHLFIGEDAA